jgi:RNA recognition motif-containing protein
LKRKLQVKARDTVFVMGLPTFYDQSDVSKLFQDCGEIASIKVAMGNATVRMKDEKGVRRVLGYDGYRCISDSKHGIKVKMYEERKRSRSRSRSRSREHEYRRRYSPERRPKKRYRSESSGSYSDASASKRRKRRARSSSSSSGFE